MYKMDHPLDTNLLTAALEGTLKEVRELIEMGADPMVMEGDVLKSAIIAQNIPMIKYLLSLPNVDPTANENIAFRTAARRGNVEIMKLLLEIPGVDPTARKNSALAQAAINGHVEAVKFLLTLPGVANREMDNFFVKDKQIKKILKYANKINWKLADAAGDGELEIVQKMIAKGADPIFENNKPLRTAAGDGQLHIVKYLLPFPGVSEGIDAAIQKARAKNQPEIVKVLERYRNKVVPTITFPTFISFTLADMPDLS